MKDKIYEVVAEDGKILKKTADVDTAMRKADKTESTVCVDGVPVDQLTMLDGYDASGLEDLVNE